MRPGELRINPGKPAVPTAEQHNALRGLLLQNRLLDSIDQFDPTPLKHPWRVRASRFDDINEAWRVDIQAGTINDRLPTFIYLRQNDPRKWKPPTDYLLPKVGEPGFNARYVERDPLDDPDDPPCLMLRDPKAKATTSDDFTIVSDNIRNGLEDGAFCGADTWELELWRAHVLLTAMPITSTVFPVTVPPPALGLYRFVSLRSLPAANVGASDGGSIGLATLYLLRDPKEPEDAQLLVRQREFWPFWAQIIDPGSDLAGLLGDLGGQGEIDSTVSDLASVEFWTV